MTKSKLLAPMIALSLALSAAPAMAQTAQPAATMTTQQPGIIAILIGLLLPAVQKVR